VKGLRCLVVALVAGRRLLGVVGSFRQAEATLLRDCPTESVMHIAFPKGVHEEGNYGWGGYFRPGQKLRFITQGYSGYGAGAIIADNIDNLIVKNSAIASLSNKHCIQTSSRCPALVHVVYLRHGVIRAKVINNRISGVSGDPFRVTDRSNNNAFAGNRIRNSGDKAIASDNYRL
jgi:hypothetical protein